jgi:exodeoxyribonuclease V alpha subunit
MAEAIDVHKVFAEYFKGCEGLAYALSSKLAEGNMCIDIEKYKEELPVLLEKQKARPDYKDEFVMFWPSAEEFEKQCNEGKYVTHSPGELKPFIIQGKKAYLHRYYQYETQIIDNIKRLGNNFHIITGGPGTGKTFSIGSRLVEEFTRNPGLNVALAAPTGKASARMNEALKEFAGKQAEKIGEVIKAKITDLKAQTLHRLLGFRKDSVFFNYDEKNRLPFDVVIIDECSMVDGSLMAKLLNAIDGKTSLWLIGDKDQLASVEAGSVFGDLCRAENSAVLNGKVDTKIKNWRFNPDKGIGRLSREVIEGKFSNVDSYSGDDQVSIVILNSDNKKENLFREKVLKSEFFRQYASLYQEYISKESVKDALASLNKVRFLCLTRENDYSVAEVNKAVEKHLRSIIKDKDSFNPREGFYHNQPVIITENDYNLSVFNGDVGLIRKEGDTFLAWFETTDGETRSIPAGYLNHYDTVFAMTIHKSQGSEFENVFVMLPEKQGEKLLTRELLYTGITRAKEKVVVMSTEDSLHKCIERTVSRASGLEKRLQNEKL